uniref:Uncharacterized protein n=1 Tax=Sphaerodactylus townsendi TaxID=933632 RepID=A0ACB8EDF6_9SAUR
MQTLPPPLYFSFYSCHVDLEYFSLSFHFFLFVLFCVCACVTVEFLWPVIISAQTSLLTAVNPSLRFNLKFKREDTWANFIFFKKISRFLPIYHIFTFLPGRDSHFHLLIIEFYKISHDVDRVDREKLFCHSCNTRS